MRASFRCRALRDSHAAFRQLAREAKHLRPDLHIILRRDAAAGVLGKLMFKPLRAREIENALEEVRIGRG